MAFTKQKPAGWNTGDVISAAIAQGWDDNLAASVDCAALTLGFTKTVTRVVQSAGTPIAHDTMLVDPSLWHLGASLDGWDWASASTEIHSAMLWRLSDLPDGCTLTAFGCYITGAAGHGATWPANAPQNMPVIAVVKKTLTAADASVGTKTDSTATTKAAYEAAHVLQVTGLTEVINNATTAYWLYVTNESGTNAQSGVTVGTPWVTTTQTALSFN